MVKGQAKAFESEAKTPLAVAENVEQKNLLVKDTTDSKMREIRVRQIFQLKKQRRIRRKKSSQII